MADIEKVIKAIECRANGNGRQGCVGWDVDCPYSFSHVFCDQNQLYLDALALLKEEDEEVRVAYRRGLETGRTIKWD